MKLNTNSNTYIIVYSSIVVIIVAFLLAFVSKALEPASLANERIDKKKQILASLNIRNINNNEVEEQYNKCISYDKIIRSDGSVVDEGNNKDGAGFKVNMKDISDDRLNTLFLLTVKDYGEVFGDISHSMKTRTPFSEPISATQVKQQDLEPE